MCVCVCVCVFEYECNINNMDGLYIVAYMLHNLKYIVFSILGYVDVFCVYLTAKSDYAR